MKEQSEIKEHLRQLREKLGWGYAPKAVKVLQEKYNRKVEGQDIYNVAHGKVRDEIILKVLCELAVEKKSAGDATIIMLKEAIAA